MTTQTEPASARPTVRAEIQYSVQPTPNEQWVPAHGELMLLFTTCLTRERGADILRVMNRLFSLIPEIEGLHVFPVDNQKLSFVFENGMRLSLDVPDARGRLRMMCARLHVLWNEQSGQSVSPYGDKAEFEMLRPGADRRRWQLDFVNTAGRQEFRVSAHTIT